MKKCNCSYRRLRVAQVDIWILQSQDFLLDIEYIEFRQRIHDKCMSTPSAAGLWYKKKEESMPNVEKFNVGITMYEAQLGPEFQVKVIHVHSHIWYYSTSNSNRKADNLSQLSYSFCIFITQIMLLHFLIWK